VKKKYHELTTQNLLMNLSIANQKDSDFSATFDKGLNLTETEFTNVVI
jgi:hypothetical protein